MSTAIRSGMSGPNLLLPVVVGAEFYVVCDLLRALLPIDEPSLVLGLVHSEIQVGTAAILLFAFFVAGILVNLVASFLTSGLTEVLETPVSKFYRRYLDPPKQGWLEAQQWIWTSRQAARELQQLKFTVNFASSTAWLSVLLVACALVGFGAHLGAFLFDWRAPNLSLLETLAVLGSSVVGSVGMALVWTWKTDEYHQLIRQAAEIGPPSASGGGGQQLPT